MSAEIFCVKKLHHCFDHLLFKWVGTKKDEWLTKKNVFCREILCMWGHYWTSSTNKYFPLETLWGTVGAVVGGLPPVWSPHCLCHSVPENSLKRELVIKKKIDPVLPQDLSAADERFMPADGVHGVTGRINVAYFLVWRGLLKQRLPPRVSLGCPAPLPVWRAEWRAGCLPGAAAL